jgi:hemolysin activation/secretion protein
VRGVAACVIAGYVLTGSAHTAHAFPQDPAPATQPEQPKVSEVRIIGASIYTPEELQRRNDLAAGMRLEAPPEAIAERIQRQYAADGYSFAEVRASLDEGVLTLEIDEGQIDAIEFRGVSNEVATRLREELAVQPGDVFNRSQASRALDQALEMGQGARAGARAMHSRSSAKTAGACSR